MDELDELRLEVAKVKGWKFVKLVPAPKNDAYLPPRDRTHWRFYAPGEVNDNDFWIDTVVDVWPEDWQKKYLANEIPDWPRDIAAAWELVEDAAQHGVGFDLCNVSYDGKTIVRYEATFYDPIGGPAAREFKSGDITAPAAICRAWLAWKRGQA